jgi:ABC-2 type transport system permease protein
VFCWLGLVLRSPSAVTNLAFLVLFPLTMASNTFVDPHTMPSVLRAIANANPVTYLVTATRNAMAGTPHAGQVAAVLLTTVVTTAVFAPLTMRAYRSKS